MFNFANLIDTGLRLKKYAYIILRHRSIKHFKNEIHYFFFLQIQYESLLDLIKQKDQS